MVFWAYFTVRPENIHCGCRLEIFYAIKKSAIVPSGVDYYGMGVVASLYYVVACIYILDPQIFSYNATHQPPKLTTDDTKWCFGG